MTFFRRLLKERFPPEWRAAFIERSKDAYLQTCLVIQVFALCLLSEHYLCRVVGVSGPSMLPTLDQANNLVLLDCFTTRFLRGPRRGEVVLAQNPFKVGHTVVKRVTYLSGEVAEFVDPRSGQTVRV